jgi:lysophospholipase L1-like esterase
MTTPILGIPELADGQIDQFATANEALRALESAGNDFAAVDLSSGDVALTSSQFAADAVFRSSGNAVARTLTVPAAKRLFIVHNGGSASLSVIRGSASISVPSGEARLLYADGTTNGLLSVAGGGGSGSGQDVLEEPTISSGVLTLDASAAQFFGVALDEDVTSLALTGAAAGFATVITAIFTQTSIGGISVSIPANVRMPNGTSLIAEEGARDITVARFLSVDGGATWLYERVADYDVSALFALPPIADENATFNDEGDSTSGWTASNGAMGVTGSTLRFTKTSGPSTAASAKKGVTMPAGAQDYILYGKIRASTGGGGVVWLENAAQDRIMGVWLNSIDTGGYDAGKVSVTGYNGATRTGAVLATGINTQTTSVDFAMQFDAKFGALNVFFRESDGRWGLKGRVACTHNTPVNIVLAHLSANASGAWIEFDFLTISRPNLAVIGDSIAEGKTLYSPNLSLGLSNYDSTWTRYALMYPSLRNNLVVNKGIGSETSTVTLARIADATGIGARAVFLHASSNDQVNGVSQGTRTSNISSMVTAIEGAGAECVLLNALYGTSANAGNPAHRDYCKAWWDTNSASVGAFTTIDIMQPVLSGGFLDPTLTQSDTVHPNPAGYMAIGGYIVS